MQKCTYKNKYIYAFDIIDDDNIINIDLEKEYRLASKQKKLFCCDCGSRVIFKFRNLDKMIPHFSHYSSSGNQLCKYAKETEEHIKAKKLLLDNIRNSYPNVTYEMRHYIKNINKYADLYFNLDNERLIIEFQKTDLDIDAFNQKIQSYNSIKSNLLWVFSENYNPLINVLRDYNLSFFKRLILDNFSNRLILLNAKTKELTILAKMTYKNKETNKVVLDKIFYKTYSIDDIKIKLDGSIDSDFEIKLKKEKKEFITDYEKRLAEEKKFNKNIKNNKVKITEDPVSWRQQNYKSENQIEETQKNKLIEKIKQKNIKKYKNKKINHYPKMEEDLEWDDIKDKNQRPNKPINRTDKKNIEDILKGRKSFLIPIICEGFKSDLPYVSSIIEILNYKIKQGNQDAKILLDKFMSYK